MPRVFLAEDMIVEVIKAEGFVAEDMIVEVIKSGGWNMPYTDSLNKRWERAGSSSRYVVLCLLLNTLCAVLAFSFFILRDGGLLVIGRDFDEQQLVFSMFSNQMVCDGMLSWSPQVDIGSSFIGSMGFYTLGSPWFWCSIVFPPHFFPYITGFLYVTKYAAAGLTSFLFIRRYVRNGHSAVLASMLYAFCGFQSSNLLFYHFHDVTALFPLMLIGLDDLVLDKKRGQFALFVCLNVLVNYFFFIGEVFFLIIYYVVRFLIPERGKALPGMVCCLAEGILGGAMGMVLLLPSVLSVLQNSRATDAMVEGLKAYNLIRYLAVVRSVLLPGEMMSAQASLYPLGEWTSCSAYLPGVGIVLVAAFIIGRKKHWLSVLLIISAVMAMIPWLNGIFSLYSGWYCRWYYMPLLFASLASAAVIDEPSRYPVRKAALLAGAATIAFVLAVTLWPMLRGREMLVARKMVFAWQLVIALGGTACTAVFLGGISDDEGGKGSIGKSDIGKSDIGENDIGKSDLGKSGIGESDIGKSGIGIRSIGRRLAKVYAMVGAISVATTAVTIMLYQQSYDKDAGYIASSIALAQQLKVGAQELIDGEGAGYRVGEKNNNLLTMAAGLPSAGSFCSTVSGSVLRFYEALGLERAVESPNVAGEEFLLSEAYSIQRPEDSNDLAGYRLEKTADTLPIGFTYNGYMKASELAAISGNDENETAKLRIAAMLTTLVIRDEDEAKVEGILEHQVYRSEPAYGLNTEVGDNLSTQADLEEKAVEEADPTDRDLAESDFEEADLGEKVLKGPSGAVPGTDFIWNRNGFSCSIQAESETFAFFSVPHDRGWSAYVNGKETEILDICGLMAIKIPKGSDDISFVYRTPGLRLGAAVSVGAWALWVALMSRAGNKSSCLKKRKVI